MGRASTGLSAMGLVRSRVPSGLATALLILLVACARVPPGTVPSASHAPAPPTTSAGTPVSANTTPISVDITVRSKRHQPVPDLQPDQLAILDGGTPVHLKSLHRVELSAASPRPIDFVFDHLDPVPAKRARKIAEGVLAAIPDTGYSLAVLQVKAHLRLLQDYTTDFHHTDLTLIQATSDPFAPASPLPTPAETELYRAIDRDALSSPDNGSLERKVLSASLQQSQQIVEDRHIYPSLAALQALASNSRDLPGRKFVFFFTQSLPASSQAHEQLQTIVRMANQAALTIYVIDVGALPTSLSSEVSSQASQFLGNGGAAGNITAAGVGPNTSSGAPPALWHVLAHDTAGFEFGDIRFEERPVLALAAGTGGAYLTAGSNLAADLLHLHEDLTTWYQASWTPPFQRFDGQFRPLEIRSARKDLTVHARSGYFALPSDVPGPLPFEEPLLNLLAQATPPAELALQAGILHLGPSPDGQTAEVVAQVPVAQLQSHDDGNTHLTSVDVAILAVIKDSQGAVIERFGEHFPLREAPSMFERPGQTITLERSFLAKPGTYTLEVAATDLIGKTSGVQRTQFTVDPVPHGPALSDIALVGKIDPVEEDTRYSEAMHYGDGRIIPNLTSNLPASTEAISFFFLLHPIPASQAQPSLRMQILREGHLLRDAPMQLHPVSGTGAAVPFLASLRGAAFPPGVYTVKVLLAQDGSTSTRSANFRITATSSVSNGPAPVPATATDPPPADDAFVLTPLAHPVPPPTPDEIHAMIEDTGRRALAWSDSLKNFLCLEVTEHFVSATAEHDWKHKATLVEMLRYADHTQTRSTLLLNGEPSTVQPDHLEFFHSNGEFGAVFHVIFDPSAHTDFTWKQVSFLDGQPVQVFAFHVERANSTFYLSDRNNHMRAAAFHGLLVLDPLTRSVRHVSITAEDLPRDLAIHASSMSVDYAFVSMQDHDFLLPVRGAVNLQESGKQPVLNQFEFHDYHRFGSRVRIHTAEEHDPAPQDSRQSPPPGAHVPE